MKQLFSRAVVAALFLEAGVATAAEAPKVKAKVVETNGLSDYRIGPEDVLQVSVFSNEALSRTIPVRPDGMITLPLLNDVRAAGLTPMELRDVLMKRLVEYMPSPEIAVIVTEVKSFMISVIGQVMRPGRYDLRSSATVVDALAMAGGFKEFANTKDVKVLRPRSGSDSIETIRFNYKDVINGDAKPFYLRSGDTVIVP